MNAQPPGAGASAQVAASGVAMLIGANVSLLVLYALTSKPSSPTVAITVLVGALIGQAIRAAAAR